MFKGPPWKPTRWCGVPGTSKRYDTYAGRHTTRDLPLTAGCSLRRSYCARPSSLQKKNGHRDSATSNEQCPSHLCICLGFKRKKKRWRRAGKTRNYKKSSAIRAVIHTSIFTSPAMPRNVECQVNVGWRGMWDGEGMREKELS